MPDGPKKRQNRCIVESAFGYNLYEAVCFVGAVTTGIATVTFVCAIFGLVTVINRDLPCYQNPILATNLVIILIFCPMSVYQIMISLLLLYQAVKMKGNAFLCSLWFTSHVCICLLYGLIFVIKSATCFYNKYFVIGILTLLSSIAYEALHIYFLVIVNSYLEKNIDLTARYY